MYTVNFFGNIVYDMTEIFKMASDHHHESLLC